jgi:hypothetical protein
VKRAVEKPRRVLLFLLVQFQSGGVDAVALAGGIRAVVENVAEVGVAAAALHLGTRHPVARVGFGLDRFLAGGSIETGPAGAGVIFRVGSKKRLAAANALVGAGRFGVRVLTSEGGLSSFLPGHIVLIRREFFLPVVFVLGDFLGHGDPPERFHLAMLACLALSDSVDPAHVADLCGKFAPAGPAKYAAEY